MPATVCPSHVAPPAWLLRAAPACGQQVALQPQRKGPRPSYCACCPVSDLLHVFKFLILRPLRLRKQTIILTF